MDPAREWKESHDLEKCMETMTPHSTHRGASVFLEATKPFDQIYGYICILDQQFTIIFHSKIYLKAYSC